MAFAATPSACRSDMQSRCCKNGKFLCFFPFLSHPGLLKQPPFLCKLWVHSELDQPEELRETAGSDRLCQQMAELISFAVWLPNYCSRWPFSWDRSMWLMSQAMALGRHTAGLEWGHCKVQFEFFRPTQFLCTSHHRYHPQGRHQQEPGQGCNPKAGFSPCTGCTRLHLWQTAEIRARGQKIPPRIFVELVDSDPERSRSREGTVRTQRAKTKNTSGEWRRMWLNNNLPVAGSQWKKNAETGHRGLV